MATDGLVNSYDFELNECILTAGNGRKIDVRGILFELNIFEDIYNNVLTGNIMLSDSNNLINKLPLAGYETISISFTKPSHKKTTYKKTYRIYKMSDRVKQSDTNENYILYFCGDHMFKTEMFSKSYSGRKISDMVNDIVLKRLGVSKTTIEPTAGIYDIVIPFMTPFKAINWLSKRAVSPLSAGSSYLFFETFKGFNFVSLENLVQKSPVRKLHATVKKIANPALAPQAKPNLAEEEASGGENYRFSNSFDVLNLVSNGYAGSTLVTVNPLTQVIEETTLESNGFFDSTKHLNKINPHSSTFSGPSTPTRSVQSLQLSTKDCDKITYGPGPKPNDIEKWYLQRPMFLGGLNMQKLSLTIPGSMEFTAGAVVEFTAPEISLNDAPVKKADDVLNSGNYLITAVRHIMKRDSHVCVIELVKDSLKKKPE